MPSLSQAVLRTAAQPAKRVERDNFSRRGHPYLSWTTQKGNRLRGIRLRMVRRMGFKRLSAQPYPGALSLDTPMTDKFLVGE